MLEALAVSKETMRAKAPTPGKSGIEDLRLPSSNRLHVLKGDRQGQHSISINMEYRICFQWTAAGPEGGEITDCH